MPTFAYIARDTTGQRIEGRLAGTSAQAVLAELQSRALAPVRVEEVREAPRLRRGVSVRHLAAAYRQLADLLRAGVPLMRGLRLLGRGKSNPRLAAVCDKVADAVADGQRLADAMAAHGEIFPSVQVAMVRAGEKGGFLEAVLARMGTFLEHQADLRARVIGSLIYPLVLLTVGTGIVIFALVAFVPRFKDFYARIQLPWPTRVLMGLSDLLTHWWLAVIAVTAIVALLVWRLLQDVRVKRALAQWQVKLPAMGPLTRALATGRFARILGTLLENGIPMLQAIAISRDAAGNILLAEAIDRAGEAVRAGETLSKPLAASGLFSEDVIEMISVGESANNLPQVLVTIADTIEKRIDRLLAVFLRLIEPLLLLCMAGAVLFIFVALIVPMMRMSSSLSSH
jgi:general secretion pathway protein F/type IV pilus assembly protein PilC